MAWQIVYLYGPGNTQLDTMIIRFNIDYQTTFGEEIVLNIGDEQHHMVTDDGHRWHTELQCSWKAGDRKTYFYSVLRSGVETRREWMVVPHCLDIIADGHYTVNDRWSAMPEDAYLYSSAFTDCLSGHVVSKPYELRSRYRNVIDKSAVDGTILCLKVRAPQLRRHERLIVVGGDAALGAWTIAGGIAMTEHSPNEWFVAIDTGKLSCAETAGGRNPSHSLELKFVVVNERGERGPMWEDRYNRVVTVPIAADNLGAASVSPCREIVSMELEQAFFRIWNTKVAGTLVPLFSLRSRASFGVGDFGDLKKMIDYVADTGQRVLQLLPINDTTSTHTWTDSYPYSCISVFALHPQYADLGALPPLADAADRERFDKLREELNALPQIDYERVNDAKNEYLQLLYRQAGKKMMSMAKYRRFFDDNKQWLVPYAQYCMLRERFGTADFTKWFGYETFREADRPALSNPRTAAYKEVAYTYFVQYILYTQMSDAHAHAREKGVILKGDIPIGVNRHGCDVWQEPRYFNMDGQAGAPPDDFSVNGQNWGFPTYNWEAMLADGCLWWERRFSNMARFFDAYRIDHVLGFFRIWEIPIDAVHGLTGQFVPALPMTSQEIEAYGLHFREDLFTRPYITDWVVQRIFGEQAEYVKATFLDRRDDYFYDLKTQYNTERKIEAASLPDNVRDGLYALAADVLFVRDHRQADRYHPRIGVQHALVYESLSDGDKYVFNRLYDDYFYRRHNRFWYKEAMKKLPRLVEATRMMVCAEDLGMVPECVAWVMNELKILSLELQSMPKDSSTRFGHLSRNPYRSVCTISSHDMPTLRQWWDEDTDRTQDYYNSMLHHGGGAPHPLPDWLAKDIIARHLTCPSMLCVLSIQDWLAMDERLRLPDADAERVNIPANPRHYWRYRMHLNIEDLSEDKQFCDQVRELIARTGRG